MTKLLELAALAEAGISLREAQKLVPVENQIHKITLQAAEVFGGPVAKALKRQAEVVAQVAAANRSLEVAFATPKATAKLMLWLPPGGFLLSQLIGLNPLPALMNYFIAQLALIVGIALQIVGFFWSRQILKKGRPVLSDSGLVFDLVAIGLRAGLSPIVVRRRLSQMVEISQGDFDQLNRLESLSRRTGAPLENLLLGQADTTRLDAAAVAQAQVAALAIKLMVPLGVVVLPAFVLMTVVPIVISVLV